MNDVLFNAYSSSRQPDQSGQTVPEAIDVGALPATQGTRSLTIMGKLATDKIRHGGGFRPYEVSKRFPSNNLLWSTRRYADNLDSQTGEIFVPARQKKIDCPPLPAKKPVPLLPSDHFVAAGGGKIGSGFAANVAAGDSQKEKKTNKRASVYSGTRTDGGLPPIDSLPLEIQALLDRRNQGGGLEFLSKLPDAVTSLVIFDPEYRGVMDYQSYGNEGERQKARAALTQMSETIIRSFIVEIARILAPKGHLMLWVDKFHLVEGVTPWLADLEMKIVDLVTWDKGRIGMGYRTRRRCEYLIVIQKLPLRAKGVWTAHDIPDVWLEKLPKVSGGHAHVKPEGLQAALIAATTGPGDVVVDPAAGSFSVMRAAHSVGRRFLGCDLKG